MSSKSFKLKKMSKILLGILVFFVASISVFATCPKRETGNGCQKDVDGLYTCTSYITGQKKMGCKVSGCIDGYELSNGKCYKVDTCWCADNVSCKWNDLGKKTESSCKASCRTGTPGWGEKPKLSASCQELKSIVVLENDDEKKATTFNNLIEGKTYSVKVSKNTKLIRIYINGPSSNVKWSVTGVGQKDLTSNSQTFPVKFTADGKTSTYYIKVTRESSSGSSGVSTSTVSEEQKCKNNGNYWNTDTSKASKGCYKLDKDNCNTFGLCGKESKCDSYCTNKVVFDSNYGKTLLCENGYVSSTSADLGSQVCTKDNVSSGEKVSFPSSSSSMYRDGQGQLIGWTSVITNGAPDCSNGVVVTDLTKTNTINSSVGFYACYQEIFNATRYIQKDAAADGGAEIECGLGVEIKYCNKENGVGYCYFNDSTNTLRKVYRDHLAIEDDAALATCDGNADTVEEEVTDDEMAKKLKACIKKDMVNGNEFNYTTSFEYDFCYRKKSLKTYDERLEKVKEHFTCDTRNGYTLDETSIEEEKYCDDDGNCVATYYLDCIKGKRGENKRPTLEVTPAKASGGVGYISVKAYAKVGEIEAYYASDDYLTPTNSSEGWESVESNSFQIQSTPGVKYIWVKDSEGNISNVVSGAVIDTEHANTTLRNVEVYDANGNIQSLAGSGTAYKVNDVTDSKYVRLSNDLNKDSKVIADGFNPYDMEYKLEVSSPTVSVYATLTSTDSNYVAGYEPRTVNLKYGINTVLIKIVNKEGITRTYTILVTRTDDRTSDNTLSDISVSVGEINFNANVTDYKIEVPKTTTSIDVNATIASDKASYVSGYEPENVLMVGNTTVKLITVKSETGRTRTYVLTFIKEGTDTITKESLQLESLKIPGVHVAFEEDVANYSLSVGYETDVIDINTVLKNDDSIIALSLKKKNDSDYKVVSSKGIGLDVGENFVDIKVVDKENEESHYRLTIIRKEFGLDISNDTSLKDLKVLNHNNNIAFDPNKKEYTIKIKQEKSLVITAVPNSNRAEVFIRGNDELTGFSTVRVKVIAENGEFETYSIDIKKDAFNKTIDIASIVAGIVIILVSSGIIIVKKKAKAKKEYFEE